MVPVTNGTGAATAFHVGTGSPGRPEVDGRRTYRPTRSGRNVGRPVALGGDGEGGRPSRYCPATLRPAGG